MKFLRTLIAGVAAFACLAAHAEDLNLGIISTDSSAVLKQRWQPLIDDLNRQTGLSVKAFFATDYSGIIEGMRFNKVQIGYFGNASAMEAVDRSNGEVFAKIVYANGDAGYYSVLITNVNSRFKTLDDVFKNTKDVTLGFGDPNSTSGSLIPGYYLFAQHNAPVNTSFKTVLPSSHEANLLAVVNNKIDIATNNTEMLDTLKKLHPDKFAQVRVLWKSPLIASDPLVWRRDLPQPTKDKLRNFFLNYAKTDAHEKQVMANITGYGGFAASSDAQLLPIRQVALFQQKQKLESNTHLSDGDRKTQIAALDAKLAALDAAAPKQ
ncbi:MULTISPECIES: phosphonate ABC transporter substrate-binding protein [Paraburkholderia]|uniref:phosphonate ABC transporter substrate-binding protein n=1 Tax=Paraburkholderia TaxID=1822464 RepID=UPI00225A406E|nr:MULTISPECIES: phosphonate ABC transporter substrate-binding protein [Paraburkholderia]MCX4162409.1 phosphonate ABC transporter substrate-binding protein [Paraburkholderia megapolitana]MDN7157904.1 phosphonate ABC transporter substrate-binding protein [Paraburkholderia sp. CHISQ3]MDQ6494951.1 phosphonate ABC transporter substrate-binding protein [Paraburkholderia megapolitana]